MSHNISFGRGRIYINNDPIEKLSATIEDEWVWVEGYKGTDKDMCCRGFQYEIGKQFDMPEGEEVEECLSGFHLCPSLSDVFDFYDVMDGNRFFKVKALVRQNQWFSAKIAYGSLFHKAAAKSIVFFEELTPDEILKARSVDISDWSDGDKALALEKGVMYTREARDIVKLTDIGWSEQMAKMIIDNDNLNLALTLHTQPELDMNTKALILFGRGD